MRNKSTHFIIEKVNKDISIFFTVFFALYLILPLFLFGENCVITIHDWLDQIPPYYKMFRDNDLFSKFDAPSLGFNGMSTLYYGFVNYSISTFFYWLFPAFIAYSINYITAISLGYFSMLCLLKKISRQSNPLFSIIAIAFATTPTLPHWQMGINTLPLVILLFMQMSSENHKTSIKSTLYMLAFPLISHFTSVGLFISFFWLLGIIANSIIHRKINTKLLLGFIFLLIGYILVDFKLFYTLLYIQEPLNREVFYSSGNPATNTIDIIISLLKNTKAYLLDGHYHAPINAGKFIAMTLFLGFVLQIIKRKVSKMFLFICFLLASFSLIAALHNAGILNTFLRQYLPILHSFNWGRVWIFNRLLLYVGLSICLMQIIDSLPAFLNNKATKQYLTTACLAAVIIQLLFVMTEPVRYNDQILTWTRELHTRFNLPVHEDPNTSDRYISYKEFYSEELFSEIKKDIDYNNEIVVAFGYHPSILMYNGFHTLDGYNNAYPKSYMQQFRRLIAPELSINNAARENFDTWGGRLYIFSSEISYKPTKQPTDRPVQLRIDPSVFTEEFHGQYIISRVELSNAASLNLSLVKKYQNKSSIYTIYLYSVM